MYFFHKYSGQLREGKGNAEIADNLILLSLSGGIDRPNNEFSLSFREANHPPGYSEPNECS